MASRKPVRRWVHRLPAAMFRSTTRPREKRSILRRCSGSLGFWKMFRKPYRRIFSELATRFCCCDRKSSARDGASVKEFGSSEYAKLFLNALWGTPPGLSLEAEAELHKCLAKLADERLLHSARDVSDGGIAVALAEGCFAKQVGVRVEMSGWFDPAIPWRALCSQNMPARC